MKKMLILGANNPELVRLFKRFQEKNPDWELVGFLDNDKSKHGTSFRGYPVLGGSELVNEKEYRKCYVVNSITRDAKTRRETTIELIKKGAKFTNLIHPNVDLSYVKLGIGLYIQENCSIQSDVIIKDHVSIHIGSLIGHETIIGKYSFIAHGCVISGKVNIDECCFIGAGAIIQPRINIGEGAIVGSGAVVTHDVKPYTVVAGCPARFMKKVGT